MGLVRAGGKNATGPCPHPGPKHTEVPPVTDREHPDPAPLIQKAILELASPGDARPRPQTPLTPGQQAAALRAMPSIADALAGSGATPGGDDVPGGRPGLCEPLREAGSLPDPFERMQVQKLIVASNSVARMLARAARSQRPEEAGAALEAAAQFTEVLRRGALALKRYRGGRRRRRGD